MLVPAWYNAVVVCLCVYVCKLYCQMHIEMRFINSHNSKTCGFNILVTQFAFM